jgi:hypothetical protein
MKGLVPLLGSTQGRALFGVDDTLCVCYFHAWRECSGSETAGLRKTNREILCRHGRHVHSLIAIKWLSTKPALRPLAV